MEAGTKKDKAKPEVSPLKVPGPSINGSSPCSSPYFQKLPPLSPRTMKGLDPNYRLSLDHGSLSPAVQTGRGSTCSAESGSSSLESESLSIATDGKICFDFQRKPSEAMESNIDDIDFFLQVVGVFQEYVNDQIIFLEAQFVENQKNQVCLQKERKKVEDEGTQQEGQLSRDVAYLVSLLHQKQLELKDKLRKNTMDAANKIREQEEQCRRNMKLISGILCFAKQLKNESGESLKENAVRELKRRLSSISNMNPPELIRHLNYPARIDVNSVASYLQSLQFISDDDDNFPKSEKTKENAVLILAPRSTGDVSKSTVTVRWTSIGTRKCSFEIKWNYVERGKPIEKTMADISDFHYVIENLPPNCDVVITLRNTLENGQWSNPAHFRTSPGPVRFSFDPNTANIKLKLTPDNNTVFYAGDKSVSPKSPSRFSFALNVLGNTTFYSGRHYWELKVNRNGWTAGVAYLNTPRNGYLGSNNSSWILHHIPDKFEYKVRHSGESSEVEMDLASPSDYLRRLGIYLDIEGGIIRFVDPERKKILFTYMEERFDQAMCAAVNPFYHGNPITLITGLEAPKFFGQDE